MNSILNNKKSDFLYLVLPSILSVLFVSILEPKTSMYLLLAVFAFYLFDAGHVYTTFLRMKAETKNDIYQIYGPLLIFAILFYSAIYLNFPYVWAIIIYATFIHNIKQNYGIAIWNARVNKLKNIWQFKFLFYYINILCFITFHVRTDLQVTGDYPYTSLLLFPSSSAFGVLLTLYAISFIFFIYLCFIQNYKKWKYILLPIVMTLTYAYSFLVAKTFEQAMIPLVISHGVSYIALIDYSRKRIFNKSSLILIITILLAGAMYELFVTDILFTLNLNRIFSSFFQAIALSFLFSHYYYDSYLWKKSHKDMSLLLNR